MSNYLQLIDAVYKVRTKKATSLFSNTTGANYYDTIREIGDATYEILMDNKLNIRGRQTTLTTVSGQREYPHIYGSIKDDGMWLDLDSGDKQFIEYEFNQVMFQRFQESGEPYLYTVYGGNRIWLYRTPDDAYDITILYDTDYPMKSVGTTDQSSASGQANVYITETEGFESYAGSTITIAPNTANEETAIISSVTTDDYITLTTNLTNTHAVGTKVELYKRVFEYEDDEPNFPEKYHKLIEYKALMELYVKDEQEFAKYSRKYQMLYDSLIRESRGTQRQNRFMMNSERYTGDTGNRRFWR